MDMQKVINSLLNNGYSVKHFQTKEAAAEYLNSEIDGETVGFGDSKTLTEMKLYETLSKHNVVIDPQQDMRHAIFMKIAKLCLSTEIYITSVNAMSETGELVNIDGTGNRVAGSLFGHRKVYFVLGINKIAPTLEDAVWRARNIAAPLNAQKKGMNTPCALKGDRCYNCSSPDRICNSLVIHYKKMMATEAEVILISEPLGF